MLATQRVWGRSDTSLDITSFQSLSRKSEKVPLTPYFSAKRKQAKKWLVELKRIFLCFSIAKEKGQSLQSRVIWHRRRGKRMVTTCPCSARYSEPHSPKPLHTDRMKVASQ